MQKPIENIPFGGLLGTALGGVDAYSSDYDSADPIIYASRKSFRSYVDGIYMGYKWQCVEFARRWMYINKGYIFDDVAMAYEIFDLESVREIASEQRLPLHSFRNGSCQHPEIGSLLIWEEGGEFERTGHVAVITGVFADRLHIAEQNVEFTVWPNARNYARELKAKTTESGDYWIECSYGDSAILGWVTQTNNSDYAEPREQTEPALLNLQSHTVVQKGQHLKSWLNVANDDENAYVKMMGGHKLTSVEADQYSYFCLSDTAQEALETATNELHGLFMHATDYVLEHDDILEKFNLPAAIIPKIRQSWDNRLNQLITSRFDFAISEKGLKIYEYNCDSASCYMEAGKVQGKWGKHFGVKRGEDAGENLFKSLVEAWRKSDAKNLVHILKDDDPEEAYHALFMKAAIEAAGLQCKVITGTQSLVWDAKGNVCDNEGDVIQWVWKTWAWETALDQIREECEADEIFEPRWQEFGKPRLVDVLLRKNIMVYEPLWTLIPSNKAILPVLWTLFPNHPNLLNTDFTITEDLQKTGYVCKPIVGRCGQNIQLVDRFFDVIEQTSGSFESEYQIYQQLFPLPKIDNYYVQVSTFTAAGIFAGSGVRVDPTMIVGKNSDCMALRFAADDEFDKK